MFQLRVYHIVLRFFGWLDQSRTDFLKGRSLALDAAKQDAFAKADYPQGAQLCLKCSTAAVVMMDGWGSVEAKVGNYNYFIGEQLIQYGGLKLFYRQDGLRRSENYCPSLVDNDARAG